MRPGSRKGTPYTKRQKDLAATSANTMHRSAERKNDMGLARRPRRTARRGVCPVSSSEPPAVLPRLWDKRVPLLPLHVQPPNVIVDRARRLHPTLRRTNKLRNTRPALRSNDFVGHHS